MKSYIKVSELYTPETVGIKFDDLTQIDDSAKHLSEDINISISTLYDKPFWFKYNGEYYYFKETLSAERLLNELIGEYISLYMDLPTIHYDIALGDFNIKGLLSKNFREKGKNYVSATDLPLHQYIYLDRLLRYVDGNDSPFKRKIDALIVKDLFTAMIDRYANTLCILSDSLELAPLFDYEYSLEYTDVNGEEKERDEYKNPLFLYFPYYDKKTRSIDEYTLKEFMKRDKHIISECEKMYALDMGEILKVISAKRKIRIPDNLLEYYQSFYDFRKEKLMKVLK